MTKILEILKPYIKMDRKITKFDDTETEEYKFHQNKIPISIKTIYVYNSSNL